MAYLKPQSPIKFNEDHIYPLTTIDQIVKLDGSRLGLSNGTLNIVPSEVGLPNPTAADNGKFLRVDTNGNYIL